MLDALDIQPETLAAIRFGYGRGPRTPCVASVSSLLSDVKRTSRQSARTPFDIRSAKIIAFRDARSKGNLREKRRLQREINSFFDDDIRFFLSNAVDGPGFGARLTSFWSDHFSASANSPVLRLLIPDLVDTAIRPNIAGNYFDMLRSAICHPALLIYLTQTQSTGPNSPRGANSTMGLNENLARELMELHTLGVDGAYSQGDVRNLAELLTGLSMTTSDFRTFFEPDCAEPGPFEILGHRFEREDMSIKSIEAALRMLVRHPDTARHIARKLVVHFIGEPVDDGLVSNIAQAFQISDGDLLETYSAMLGDDRAWQPGFRKAKMPLDLIVSGLRVAGLSAEDIEGLSRGAVRQDIRLPMEVMGQDAFRPVGPDGWREDFDAWITPQGIAGRINWAFDFSRSMLQDHTVEKVLDNALGEVASDRLRDLVSAAPDEVDAKALILASPEFNRR